MIKVQKSVCGALEHGHVWVAMAGPLWALAGQLHGAWETGCYVLSTALTLVGIGLGAPDECQREEPYVGAAVEE